ncbi:MAG: hypothetical protein AMXMBFR81_27820 [Chthonomonas sp.]
MRPKKLIILVEEQSMKTFLDHLLPSLGLDCEWQIIPHEGKSDLERSAPRKLRAWTDPTADLRFIVMRDNDGGNCQAIKQDIYTSCAPSGRLFLVRIVMQELESWLLADLAAVDAAYPGRSIAGQAGKAKFRNPDMLVNATQVIEDLTGDRGKISRADCVGSHYNLSRARSRSLRVLVEGIRRLVA